MTRPNTREASYESPQCLKHEACAARKKLLHQKEFFEKHGDEIARHEAANGKISRSKKVLLRDIIR